jgi:hypothetical protein
MADTNAKKIRLGICMAGAVSAGAYTAGEVCEVRTPPP